ncbi:alpha,alpha-phosphotrehalase [Paenibacillus dendritiformis]|uniref:Alpha,alpha-phosphotrehalase n=1 Tax=Paenibacillus dendritiformis C454 TaxID=1131935 RepID=H3SMD2_9BACL|nr:alpha,alpha-phosphotrehalase [Paenibacillus dendritiformis]EHQ59762.1 alpha,alpha-phosphotrehalase [Paenibacillus dendritiformis C454]CAH8772597.1 alpha,alpha-phosphotrehalase [Paenibacillus dendritiformis]
MQEPWWKRAAVYQIYPKSFLDTTGNGLGDINGIMAQLDYLRDLGVDVIWLTPIYASPEKDNGYDISDYYAVNPQYGTMEDFDKLLDEAHRRGIKVIMDIVVNHTSTEHPWFQQSCSSLDNPYRDYYIWREPNNGQEPNNWQSKFGGSAWKYDEKTKQYYLHLFDVTQADLNWENTDVRQEVYQMMNFWLAKGVDGFRLDVINLISKDQNFPNDSGENAQADGRKYYTDGPRVHEYLHEMNQEVFANRETMTVGEMSSTSIEECIKYTNPERQELNMTFNFHHLKVDYPGGEKWAKAEFDFIKLKQILSEWQIRMHDGEGWNALFWCNHDQPRIVSRFGDSGKYRVESAKMLGTTIHMLQGTPYIYQGEEIGMTNPEFDQIADYRDVESLNMYNLMREQGKSHDTIMDILKQKSRDNSRTPMQWNRSAHGGFTKGTPWIQAAPNYPDINVEAALQDQDSIFYHYQKLIQLRKQYDIITYGDYRLLLADHEQIFAYARQWQNETLLVVNNFYREPVTLTADEIGMSPEHGKSEILLSNYADSPEEFRALQLRPYESIVYYWTGE